MNLATSKLRAIEALHIHLRERLRHRIAGVLLDIHRVSREAHRRASIFAVHQRGVFLDFVIDWAHDTGSGQIGAVLVGEDVLLGVRLFLRVHDAALEILRAEARIHSVRVMRDLGTVLL